MSVAVIFEVEPDPECFEAYLGLAASLAPRLATVEGFIGNERFRSRHRPGRLVSLSLWENEAAAIRWRENALHRSAQDKGRGGLLKDYRIRVGNIVDGRGDLVLLQSLEGQAGRLAAAGYEVFVNIRDPSHALALGEEPVSGSLLAGVRAMRVEVLRDYGLMDRDESPRP
ncbi:antibiotic biosynthesis monooxygenase family protein [Luteibacter yeojuensis]|uniref:Antibiotic biosynthesis monooxygenase n=1 Tax=Luteibacter yeojuensis TaxID=345309 RepID=A0A7X5QVY4_9GAMM|nr:antibiotic biosynthesis monooxygenase family protein [Luteibacter yeojuensis]NID16371.1 antibiotic biosynthesis monooxygenase [Luteibacter yeojuensis]